ncbi:MAG: hypothetical protein ACP6IY_20600 [Promethearchaeia archaeon]
MLLTLSDIIILFLFKINNKDGNRKFDFLKVYLTLNEKGLISEKTHLSRELRKLWHKGLIKKCGQRKYFLRFMLTQKGIKYVKNLRNKVEPILKLIGLSDIGIIKEKITFLKDNILDILERIPDICYSDIKKLLKEELTEQEINGYNLDAIIAEISSRIADIIYDRINEFRIRTNFLKTYIS